MKLARHRRLVFSLAVVLAASALVAAVAQAGPFGPAQFTTPCRYSHSGPVDPIVKPGVANGSHLHDFFGNVSTDASSTYRSLRAAGATTCLRPEDLAAYWVPALYAHGHKVTPVRAQIYYLGGRKDPAGVRAFPAGLRMIAGDSKATRPQSPQVTSWHCSPESGIRMRTHVPTCARGDRLRLQVRFPDCWDGRHLDAPNHKSHMAYSVRHGCPASHPVPLPKIQLNVVYPIRGGRTVSLSSGGAYSAHADFFNAWDQSTLEALVRRCINGRVKCGRS